MNEAINETMNKIMNQNTQITQEDLARSTGPLMLEFGATWCSHCLAAQPLIATALLDYQHVRHIRIEDGIERSRLVRPRSAQAIADALHEIGFS